MNNRWFGWIEQCKNYKKKQKITITAKLALSLLSLLSHVFVKESNRYLYYRIYRLLYDNLTICSTNITNITNITHLYSSIFSNTSSTVINRHQCSLYLKINHKTLFLHACHNHHGDEFINKDQKHLFWRNLGDSYRW